MRPLELGAIHAAAVSLARDLREGRFVAPTSCREVPCGCGCAYAVLDELAARSRRLGAPLLDRAALLREYPAQSHGLCAATATGANVPARLDDFAREIERATTTDAPPPRAA